MIRVGGSNPHAYFETSHISVPEKNYAKEQAKRSLTSANMRKVGTVYVGSKHVYPEPYRYTLKYRMRLDFSFNGNSYGLMRPSYGEYAEAITTGYIEDTVRIDTAFPVYIRSQELENPDDYYRPYIEGHEKYSKPPWGTAELYKGFSGTEYLVTPPCALFGAIPYSGEYESYGNGWRYGTGIYRQYSSKWRAPGQNTKYEKMGYRYVIQRVLHSHTEHPAYSKWDADEETYSTAYSIKARRTVYPYQVANSVYRGWYANTQMGGTEIPVSPSANPGYGGYIRLGLTYRPDGEMGEGGLFLLTDMSHYSSSNYVLHGSRSTIYGYEMPGHRSAYTLRAPMFSGHKHIDCYDSSWNAGRQEITSWEDPQMDSWSHTDLNGSFAILENNNPAFVSIGDYVRAYFE